MIIDKVCNKCQSDGNLIKCCDKETYIVFCGSMLCNARSDEFDNKEDAIKNWNEKNKN